MQHQQDHRVSENGLPRSAVLGVLGGGQLGRMLALSCANLGVTIKTLDPNAEACAGPVSGLVQGHFRHEADILQFSDQVDVLTVEIEHVDVAALRSIRTECEVQPNCDTLELIQDKFLQKQHIVKHDVPVGEFCAIENKDHVKEVGERYGYPLMLKSRRLAYDGKGNFLLEREEDVEKAWSFLGGQSIYAERFQAFSQELAVMLVRTRNGSVSAYPVTQTVHKDNICHMTETPAQVSSELHELALKVATQTIACLPGVLCGVFAVEMFVVKDTILVNEIAPRPHNSGHYTMDACVTSQFENQCRSIMGWSVGSTTLHSGHAIMLNLLGESDDENEGNQLIHGKIQRALELTTAKVHWYGKKGMSRNRKLGHINFVGPDRAACLLMLSKVDPAAHQSLLAHTMTTMTIAGPQVSVIMGSDSDLKCMIAACDVLEKEFNLQVEVTIVSAHRTPERLVEYAKHAHERGIKVIIAGAGGAAHLPGMVAALTPLPVIGVPVLSTSSLGGMDALLSICQMPRGVPVATVAIGNATNAALLAVRILSTHNPELLQRMLDYQTDMKNQVLTKAEKFTQGGWRDYSLI